MAAATHEPTRRRIEAVWRIEAPKLVASLMRLVNDIDTAEDLAQDALVAALERWPADGVPENPGGWLMTTAKRRAIDRLRREQMLERKHDELLHRLETADAADREPGDDIGDDLLRLIFIACHPVLGTEARVALTLRLLGGLTTDEIARAFLAAEPTIAQRIVRAKRTLSQKGIAFEVPEAAERAERLAPVLEVVYLIFNEGYTATKGEDWIRPALCEEAVRLGRMLAGLAPDNAEVHGLSALMQLQASRLAARAGPSGEAVLLEDQDRSRWDRVLIRRGLAALQRAEELDGEPGPYTLQAAIAACHARAPRAEATDWTRIAALYGVLARAAPSPVVELNRAVAVGMAFGPGAGLALVEALADEPALRGYHLLPGVRGDFLFKLGRYPQAREAFEQAASLARNRREHEFLLKRAAACGNQTEP